MANRRSEAPRVLDSPSAEHQFFKLSLVKDGWAVAARIVRHEDGRWQAFINGDPEDEGHPDPVRARSVTRIWNYGVRISEDEYHVLIGTVAWAMANAPDAPEANPMEPIDLNKLNSLW